MSDAPNTNGHSPLTVAHDVKDPLLDVHNIVENALASDKIDMDIQEPESDVRHEPLPIKIDKLDNASIRPEVGTPLLPDSIAIEPPKGTPPPAAGELLEDVKMAESTIPVENGDVHMTDAAPNGNHVEHHQPLKRDRSPTPPMSVSDATASHSLPASASYDSFNDNSMRDADSAPPPAKRARTSSDPDQASVVHNSAPATPVPATPASPPPPSAASDTTMTGVSNGATPVPTPILPSGPASLSIPQYRFCQSTVRTLKKSKDAGPFIRPVDPVALNIPHYLTIIKTPMDFSTIERKLASSNPAKPDPNLNNPRYNHAEEFVQDVRTIFANCITFNGPEHAVSAMGKRVEEIFDKQVKNMPAPLEPVKKPPTPPPVVPAKKATIAARRPSTSVPVIRRSETEAPGSARPKREIHPPPPKDLPYADAPKKTRKGKGIKNDGTAEQLRFCGKLLSDLSRKAHWTIASPFYEPVDWERLELPTYPKIIKKPMDLGTMKRKLDDGEYPSAQAFHNDFKLMIKNCTTFNPDGTPVNTAGRELERLWNEKWKGLPPLHEVSDDEDDEEEDESEDERARAIAMMESQMETMKANLAALKSNKIVEKKPKKEKKKEKPVASSSKLSKPSKTNASNGAGNKRKGKKPVADDDVLTFEQKKDLSEAIQTLDGTKLEKVIQIIHEGVPEIRDSTEEIELEIDLLPAMVLTKLYNYVLRPLRAPPTKRNRTGKGTGTGGLKRKSMDEDVEAEKIRQLEERMRLFETGGQLPASVGPISGRGDDSEHSSDSSDASDSSGSDSE